MRDFLIIGGDAAGLSAAVQIKRKKSDAEILVVNKGRFISYGACGIPYVISGDIPKPENLIHFTPENFEKLRGIPIKINHEALEIFPAEHEVAVKDLHSGKITREAYGKLLIATGARPRKLPFLDIGRSGIFNLQNIEDLKAVLDYIDKQNPRSAAIIGAGNIGLELTEALHSRGMKFILLEALAVPAAGWPDIVQRAVVEKIKEKKIPFYPGTLVQEISREGGRFNLKTDNRQFSADMIFSVVGVLPATEFCGDSIRKMDNGAVLADRRGRTSDPDIFAAGDCAAVYHRVLEKYVYFPLGSTANKMGRIAGMNMCGEKLNFPGILGTQIFKFFELSLARTGLDKKSAEKEGIEADSFSTVGMDRSAYYPGAENVKVEIVCEKKSGRLLGAAVVCCSNAAQFIDPAAAAVFHSMSAADLAWFDAAYAPPYAPVWNALISAAFKGLRL